MRVCLFLLVTLVVVLLLAETGSASKGKRKSLQKDGTAPEEGERRRGNRHGKERKDKKGRGRHQGNPAEEEQEEAVIVGYEEIPHEEHTADEVPATPVTQEEEQPQETPAEEAHEEEPTPASRNRGHKKGHKGAKAEGGNADKAARHAAKAERLRARQEKQAMKEQRKQGKAVSKATRKEAKRGENQEEREERKQARKEAKKMERMNNVKSDCSEHSDCPTGSCCQQRGPAKKCRAFNKAEGSMCFNDCVCAEGFECFVREGKQAKHPEGTPKGRCRSTAVDDAAGKTAEEEQEAAPAQDEEE